MASSQQTTKPEQNGTLDRRALLVGGGIALTALASIPLLRRALGEQEAAFVARGQRYDGPLEQTIREGLLATGLVPEMLRGRSVLLKPNLVEPRREMPHMTTHPAVVAAAAGVFRAWGARVTVGEASGHVRDTEMAVVESGTQAALDATGVEFADLNYEEVTWANNRGKASDLEGFYLPRSVAEADLVVSMPKLKTHHWAGMTASMKNLYGVLPGLVYGWPKNVLHHAGIPETVLDINAALPATAAIIDAIDCMEGDGPIMGSAKPMGLILVGTNLPAVDATAARIMGLLPERISYLALAEGMLGPLAESQIDQRGEPWRTVASPFEILDEPHLRPLRAGGELVS